MEDRFAAADLTGDAAFGAAHRAGFFAVYDGHSGHEAAEYLESHLQSYVLAAGPDALAAEPLRVGCSWRFYGSRSVHVCVVMLLFRVGEWCTLSWARLVLALQQE
jgi:hypothetical protein